LCFRFACVCSAHLFIYYTHPTSFYFLHLCLTSRTPPVYFVHLPHVIVLHPMFLSIVFGPVVVFTSCIPTNHSCTSIFCFPLLFFLNNYILFFFFFFYFFYFVKKNIFENYKNYKYRKNKKNVLFHFYCICPTARVMWHFLPNNPKNTKNNFLSLFVSIRPLASCDTCFQVIQKYKKKYKFSKYKNINIFKQKKV